MGCYSVNPVLAKQLGLPGNTRPLLEAGAIHTVYTGVCPTPAESSYSLAKRPRHENLCLAAKTIYGSWKPAIKRDLMQDKPAASSQLAGTTATIYLDARAELAGTPLAPLQAEGGSLHQSPFAAVHLSDFLRYVLLWKRGGVYLDSDVIEFTEQHRIRVTFEYIERHNNAVP
ncbi:hypothetical protein HPB52_007881 [Rhipicephalus sanguineus]|uniref:Alpha-1,4-N-acetylglucosaminyltransferase n=1 Tax=Rhipicephalus sanguineus TaxID=34632 RepID=A0A9D4PQR0_RHISA|nr:hypothetical protein HPB52_007881 [Rhipicephalus sanguineus]